MIQLCYCSIVLTSKNQELATLNLQYRNGTNYLNEGTHGINEGTRKDLGYQIVAQDVSSLKRLTQRTAL